MLKRIVLILIRLYQRFFSIFFYRSCRFYPSCSEYAYESIERFGLFIGICKSIWRILRCHPFSKGGYDPVVKMEEKWNEE